MPSSSSITGTGTAQTGLGGAQGYGEVALPRNDDGAAALDVSAVFESGLNYFGQTYAGTDLFVNSNGTLSFLSPLTAYPTADNAGIGRDVDSAREAVTLTWDQTGVYRRNAELTNRLQLQLVDRGGGDLDIVMRYEQIDWIRDSAQDDSGARVGLASNRHDSPAWMFDHDGAAALSDLPQMIGNTGLAGLWVYEMRDGALQGRSPGAGRVAQGSAGADRMLGTAGCDQLGRE